jgi:hypothetical protein
MKKLLVAVAVLGLVCTASLKATAEDNGAATDKKAFKKEMLAKYDTNKDGKLDKDEISKMSKEDHDKWTATFGHHGKKKSDSDSSSTNAPATK